jgi:hypothetical protein
LKEYLHMEKYLHMERIFCSALPFMRLCALAFLLSSIYLKTCRSPRHTNNIKGKQERLPSW